MIFMLLTDELEHQEKVHHQVANMAVDPAISEDRAVAKNGIESSTIRFNRRLITEFVGHLSSAADPEAASYEKEYAHYMNEL